MIGGEAPGGCVSAGENQTLVTLKKYLVTDKLAPVEYHNSGEE